LVNGTPIRGIAVVVALILVGTSLRGLTTSAHVVGTTQASHAEALYHQALGASASQRPTDVIVVSSKSSTVSDGNFQQFVARLAAQVRTDPGVTHVHGSRAGRGVAVGANSDRGAPGACTCCR
jgi:hypothetical protein